MRLVSCLGIVSMLLFISASGGCKRKPPAPPVEDQPQVAQVEKKPEPKKEEKKPEPKKEEKKPDLKAPIERQGVVYNVRMAAMRPETQNDMKQIGLFYVQESATGSPPLTVDAFKKLIMRDAPKIVEKIDKGDFLMNLKGRKLQPNEILAYEYEAGSPAGHCVVRANGDITTDLPTDQLRKELGIK